MNDNVVHYPFGMLQPGRSFSSPSYRYGFQGQEKDDEVKGSGNSINYKYRMHNPRIGRFFAIDPLAPKYPHNSPYAFSENSVVAFIEFEGLEKVRNLHTRINYASTLTLIADVTTIDNELKFDRNRITLWLTDKDGALHNYSNSYPGYDLSHGIIDFYSEQPSFVLELKTFNKIQMAENVQVAGDVAIVVVLLLQYIFQVDLQYLLFRDTLLQQVQWE